MASDQTTIEQHGSEPAGTAKVAFVTGAGSGIGAASARTLARQGYRVAVVGHSLDSAREVVASIEKDMGDGAAILALECEVSDPESVSSAVERVREKWGRLDVVVASAGVNGVWAPLAELEPQEWSETIAVNLTGTFLTVKYALPLLTRAGGAVVIVSSINGTRTFSNSGASAYSASKAGQVAFAKMIAVELAEQQVRVNVICPGAIDTEIDDNTERRHLEHVGLEVEYPQGQIPLTGKRPGSSQQVADLVAFLVSDAASHITGTEVWIDGGQSLVI